MPRKVNEDARLNNGGLSLPAIRAKLGVVAYPEDGSCFMYPDGTYTGNIGGWHSQGLGMGRISNWCGPLERALAKRRLLRCVVWTRDSVTTLAVEIVNAATVAQISEIRKMHREGSEVRIDYTKVSKDSCAHTTRSSTDIKILGSEIPSYKRK